MVTAACTNGQRAVLGDSCFSERYPSVLITLQKLLIFDIL